MSKKFNKVNSDKITLKEKNLYSEDFLFEVVHKNAKIKFDLEIINQFLKKSEEKSGINFGISGTINFKKRNLGKLIKILSEDDLVIVSELSRLSRSMVDMYALAKIFADKKVKVYCIKENLEIGNTALGLMIMTVFAFSAQIERERISERTKEALAKRKADGMKLGRPKGSKNSFYKLINDEELNESMNQVKKDIEEINHLFS